MLGLLRQLIPDLTRLEDAPIKSGDRTVGFHSILFREGGIPAGGGCGETIEKARRIAVAECIERALFFQLKASPSAAEFLIPEYPTSCGFAAGFNDSKTRLRALFEAAERWHWSQWIDRGCRIDQVQVDPARLTDYSRYFLGCFDHVGFYRREFQFCEMALQIGIVLGIKGEGVFPGSRVAQAGEDLWSHGLVEAWRHLEIFRYLSENTPANAPIVDRRILFFGKNKEVAFEQISAATKSEWAEPKLRLLKSWNPLGKKAFFWRAVCHDYIGWDKGDERRFVY